VVVYLERGAGLHMAQLMPLPLTVSCFSKIQIGFTFLVPAHPGSAGQRAVKWMCVWYLCYIVKLNNIDLRYRFSLMANVYISKKSNLCKMNELSHKLLLKYTTQVKVL